MDIKTLRKKILRDFLGIKVLAPLLSAVFKIFSITTTCKVLNQPTEKQFIIALLHCDQCGLYGLERKQDTHIMISNSADGQIVSSAAKFMGFKVVSGSSSRNAVSATKKIIDLLKNGQCAAITTDGPRGPKGFVHKGIVSIAKVSQVPIIPMVYYSPQKTFLKFNTWDEFRIPVLFCKFLVNFGQPIWVDKHINEKQLNEIRKNIAIEIQKLYTQTQFEYFKVFKR